MINNVNQVMLALMGKNAKKPGSTDTNTDAFQSLLAALMSQGMNMQSNNMEGFQSELQGQLADMIGSNNGDMSTTDVFGVNPALMRMLTKLNGSTDDAQSDNGSGSKGLDGLMNVFQSGKGQNSSNYSIDAKVVEDLLSDFAQGVQGTVHDNMTITQEIIDSLTTLNDRMVKSQVSEKSMEVLQGSASGQNAMLSQKTESTASVSEFVIQDNKEIGVSKEGDSNQANTELKAKIVEKSEDKQFIVTRPEVLKILKGENANTHGESESISYKNNAVINTEGQDTPENVILKTELSTGHDSEEKKGDKPELKQDASFQTSDMRSFQRVQETAFEAKHPAVVNKEDVINQVLEKVKLINGKDISELHINLKPETLGEVSIKLVMEKGAMTARILVENSQVKSLIDSSLPQIKENLKNQNINVASLNVSVNIGQGDSHNNREFSFNRWTFNKKGNSRAANAEGEGRVETIRPREVYTQRSGLNLLA